MGIRIHKVLGYGLTDLQVADGKIVDPRINPKSVLLSYSKSSKLEPYLEYLRDRASGKHDGTKDISAQIEATFIEQLSGKKKQPKATPYDCVTWETEGGLPNVFVLTPLGLVNEWHRWDDTIDYYEAEGNPEPGLKLLKTGAYPYDGWMDSKTGDPLNTSSVSYWRHFRETLNQSDKEIDEVSFAKTLTYFAKEAGYKGDTAEFEQRIAPSIPDPIRFLVDWGQLFVNPKDVLQLRPMIYTYWN